ncbi:hypothetical protein KC361_g122 [Hortaea werneckii]|nr:hypothetical protein KC361_g122 [Hortaea werneckii]
MLHALFLLSFACFRPILLHGSLRRLGTDAGGPLTHFLVVLGLFEHLFTLYLFSLRVRLLMLVLLEIRRDFLRRFLTRDLPLQLSAMHGLHRQLRGLSRLLSRLLQLALPLTLLTLTSAELIAALDVPGAPELSRVLYRLSTLAAWELSFLPAILAKGHPSRLGLPSIHPRCVYCGLHFPRRIRHSGTLLVAEDVDNRLCVGRFEVWRGHCTVMDSVSQDGSQALLMTAERCIIHLLLLLAANRTDDLPALALCSTSFPVLSISHADPCILPEEHQSRPRGGYQPEPTKLAPTCYTAPMPSADEPFRTLYQLFRVRRTDTAGEGPWLIYVSQMVRLIAELARPYYYTRFYIAQAPPSL